MSFVLGAIILLAITALQVILFCLGAALMPWPPKDVEAKYWEKRFWKMVEAG